MRLPLLLTLALLLTLPASARPFEIDDLFRAEALDQAVFSPDGGLLAYVRRRPWGAAPFRRLDWLGGQDRADIWLVPVDGGPARNLTRGAEDGTGHWLPTWSPDGRRLAFLSTRGGPVSAWVWERDTDSLRQVTGPGVYVWTRQPLVWAGPGRLLCPLFPEGRNPAAAPLEEQAMEKASQAWRQALEDREAPTASILDSRQGAPSGRLAVVDLASGGTSYLPGSAFEVTVSPDGRRLAALVGVEPFRPGPEPLTGQDLRRGRTALRVAWVGAAAWTAVDGLPEMTPVQMAWSPDGSELAVLGPRGEVFLAGGPGAARAAAPDLAAVGLAWAGERLLLRAPALEAGLEWWILEAGQAPRRLAPGLSFPGGWAQVAPGPALVALDGGGDLWRLPLDGSPPQKLATGIASVEWPRAARPEVSELVVLAQGRLQRLPMRDPADRQPLPDPVAQVRLVDYSPATATAALEAETGEGGFLWLGRPGRPAASPVARCNAWLAAVDTGTCQALRYTRAGKEAGAWLLLPAAGGRGPHPTVVWLYPGAVYRGPDPPRESLPARDSPLNAQILAAAGYAVLFPSLPAGPLQDPGGEIEAALAPALEAAVASGRVDPSRLALLGHSYGGYAVAALLTRSPRFRAGVWLAGLTDLASFYGTFDARWRYTDEVNANLWPPVVLESAQMRLDALPWQDPSRFVRASPLFEAGRITTPLLLIHGDMDYVSLQQAEELYTALYRQGKRVRFVRYWGEGHTVQRPANARHMWQEILAWLGEHTR